MEAHGLSSRGKTVLISGGGIAGLTLAYWLHHHGLQPTIIEQAPGLRPEGYAIVSMPLGATLRLGTRIDGGGFMGLFADFDYSITHVSFPDDGRSGTLRSMTFGFTFGSMFDLR